MRYPYRWVQSDVAARTGRRLQRCGGRLPFIARLAGGVLGLAVFTTGVVQAQTYPERQVTILVPFTPGGATDIFSRILGGELQRELKQPFVIENRPGAGSGVAASALAKAAPDGHTIMIASAPTFAINPALYTKLSYDPKDLAPIGIVGSVYFVLVANPSVPAKTLPELIAYIKSKPPGSVSYGSAGHGTPHHLFMEMLISTLGIKMQHVPYRGGLPALTDVVSGVLPLMIVDLPPALNLISDGKVRAFGVTGAARARSAPDVPTIAEAGLPGYVAESWFSVVTRVGTPKPIIDKLNTAIMAYIKSPSAQERLHGIGVRPLTSTPEEFATFIVHEQQKWAKIISDANIKKIEQ